MTESSSSSRKDLRNEQNKTFLSILQIDLPFTLIADRIVFPIEEAT